MIDGGFISERGFITMIVGSFVMIDGSFIINGRFIITTCGGFITGIIQHFIEEIIVNFTIQMRRSFILNGRFLFDGRFIFCGRFSAR